MQQTKTCPVDVAMNVVKELGGPSAVARILHVAPASVAIWKKKGIPESRFMFLKLAYPDLKAWDGLSGAANGKPA